MENTFTYTARSAYAPEKVVTFTLYDNSMSVELGVPLEHLERALAGRKEAEKAEADGGDEAMDVQEESQPDTMPSAYLLHAQADGGLADGKRRPTIQYGRCQRQGGGWGTERYCLGASQGPAPGARTLCLGSGRQSRRGQGFCPKSTRPEPGHLTAGTLFRPLGLLDQLVGPGCAAADSLLAPQETP
jgi:hypothetical protein